MLADRKSLTFRLVTAATVGAVVALFIAGLMLRQMFTSHIERRFDDALKAQMYDLVAAAEWDSESGLKLAWRPTVPRFNEPFSGWYWLISDGSRVLTWSDSLVTPQASWPLNTASDSAIQWLQLRGPADRDLRAFQRRIRLPGSDQYYYFSVTGPVSDINSDVLRFSQQLGMTLLVFAAGLVIAIVMLVRRTLKPLQLTRREITAIRRGQDSALRGVYPPEITPLTEEINALLAENSTIIERARLQASNLAHALKNPLTVIRNEAQGLPAPSGHVIRQQAELLSQNANRYLHRVRIVGSSRHLGTGVDVAEVLNDLVFSMQLLYRQRQLDIQISCPAALCFRGDRQDLEELMGNVIDNACKWAKTQVIVSARQLAGNLQIRIDDDGPGIPEELQSDVFLPGQRLDQSVEGSGLGLHIVRDIVELYQGTVSLGESDSGGARVQLGLPLMETEPEE